VGVAVGVGDGDELVLRVPALLGALVQAVDGLYQAAQGVVAVQGGVACGVGAADALALGVVGLVLGARGRRGCAGVQGLDGLGLAPALVVAVGFCVGGIDGGGEQACQGGAVGTVFVFGGVASGSVV
jgi:hypothetical protein